jgi:hypothetical protein
MCRGEHQRYACSTGECVTHTCTFMACLPLCLHPLRTKDCAAALACAAWVIVRLRLKLAKDMVIVLFFSASCHTAAIMQCSQMTRCPLPLNQGRGQTMPCLTAMLLVWPVEMARRCVVAQQVW